MFNFVKISHITAVIFLMWSTNTLAWWNDAWPYRMPLNVDTSTATGAGIENAHEEVTILVKLHSGNFEDFFLVKEDLSDLRFIDGDDKTPLKHHVESFDFLNQLAYIWVKVPDIQGKINTGKLWMYYGNSEAVSSVDSGASYDQSTAAVFHFSGEQIVPVDSSAYAANASAFTGVIEANSVIANGARFSAGSHLKISDSPATAVTPDSGMTYSFWLKSDHDQQNAWLLHRSDGVSDLHLGLQGNRVYAQLKTSTGEEVITPEVAAITTDVWHHIVLKLSDQVMSVHVDGVEVTNAAINLLPFGGDFTVGASLNADFGFEGVLDELRIDNTARDNDWLKLSLSSQHLSNKLLSYQPGEQLGSGGGDSTTFFSVIFTSTGMSGWIVIALLGLMAFMSWVVMVGKMIFLRSVKKDNAGFLAQFAELGDADPGMLNAADSDDDESATTSPIMQAIFGEHDHFQSSPLYRVYHRGIEEVHSRMANQSVGAQACTLSAGSISAIKASINTQMVRELGRLNNQMVLLTIAISGGPFLGLFGTVLGVMITFAAIAATGDVNIAAIAPGVAAALLTTIVGLMVAIPAMFAYNWLQTDIKRVISEMRVFSDQFITRIAEYYGSSD